MITWEGDWTEADKAAAMDALYRVSFALSDAEMDGAVMKRLFGNITLEALPEVAGKYHGYVSKFEPRRIQLEIGEITTNLVLHELGHSMILTDEKPNIADRLSETVIRTASGKAVTGAGRGGYCRHMGYKATRYTGYKSINYPEHQHPVSFKDEAANSSTEDFCDMWLSWVTGNIADNEAGQAIRAFVEDYLKGRLA